MYKKFASIQNSTEVYILKSTMQYIDGLPGPSKRKLKEEGEFSSERKKIIIGNSLCVSN